MLFRSVNYPWAAPKFANFRVVGIADLARVIEQGGTPRASGEMAMHVLDVLEGMLKSGASGKPVTMSTTCARPPVMTADEAKALLR